MQQVRVTPLEIARLRFDLGQDYDLPDHHPAARAVDIPVLAYHLALPGRSVLVDAPSYQADTTPEAYRLPGFRPPPPLLDQLRSAGIDAADVSDVVITHAHFDHLGALARDQARRNQARNTRPPSRTPGTTSAAPSGTPTRSRRWGARTCWWSSAPAC